MNNSKQLIREIEALMLLDHPNLVKLIDYFEDSQCIYLVLEYLSGGELFEILQDKECFTEDKARKIFR